jgi:hypothetical protein
VPERATIQPFFATEGGFLVYIFGHSPALVEVLAKAHVTAATSGFGPQVIGEIPLIETVPEGLYASFEEGAIEVGGAVRRNGHTVSYITLPKRCPRGGWVIQEHLKFLGEVEASASSRMACPHG